MMGVLMHGLAGAAIFWFGTVHVSAVGGLLFTVSLAVAVAFWIKAFSEIPEMLAGIADALGRDDDE